MNRVTHQTVLTTLVLPITVLAISVTPLFADEPALPPTTYMGGPVELVKAPNGAIANKRILDGISEVAWVEPTIEQPAEGIWVFGGYGLAPISIIDTDEGLRQMAYVSTGANNRAHLMSQALALEGTLTLPRVVPPAPETIVAFPGTFVDYFRVRIDPAKAVVIPATTLIQGHM